MLKFENVAKVGERIRAYDFYRNSSCYVEGVVERISEETGCRTFVITVDKDGWPDKPEATPGQKVIRDGSRLGVVVFVSMEVAFMEWDGRIVNLSGKVNHDSL